MEPLRIWKKGERVSITYRGRIVTGRVEMASSDGRSLMLAFQALLGGYAGHMPVQWCEPPGEYRDFIVWAPVELAEPVSKTEQFSV